MGAQISRMALARNPRTTVKSETCHAKMPIRRCSLAADSRVTQTVNGSKGIHCMIAKTIVYG